MTPSIILKIERALEFLKYLNTQLVKNRVL